MNKKMASLIICGALLLGGITYMTTNGDMSGLSSSIISEKMKKPKPKPLPPKPVRPVVTAPTIPVPVAPVVVPPVVTPAVADVVTLNSITIDGTNVIVDYTKNFATCAHLYSSSGQIMHTQNLFCANSGPVTVKRSDIDKFPLKAGDIVYMIHGNNGNVRTPVQVVQQSSMGIEIQKNMQVTNGTLSTNLIHQKIGSFLINNPNMNEDLRVTQLTIALNGTSPLQNISGLVTSDNTAPIQPQLTNIIPVDIVLAAGNTTKIIDIYADIGSMSSVNISTTLSVKSVGLITNTVKTSIATVGQTMSIAAPATLNTPTLVVSQSTPSQYIATGNGGATDASKAQFNFTSSGGPSTITELKFKITSSYNYSIIQGKIGSVSAIPVNGEIWFTGLNIAVPEGATGVNVDLLLTYGEVSGYGIPTGTTTSMALNYVKYTSNNVSNTICTPAYGECTNIINTNGITTPTMTLVVSKPQLSVPTNSNGQLVFGTKNKIAEVTISAESKGDIRIKNIVWNPTFKNYTPYPRYDNIVLTDSNSTPVGYCVLLGRITCEIGNSRLDTGFLIPSGTQKTFFVYAVISGSSSSPSEKAELSMILDANYFVWSDSLLQNNLYAGGFGGSFINNFPVNTYTIKQ